MKAAIVFPANSSVPATWCNIADSALANAGKPFFIPSFADKFVASPVVAVKINRLGKSIESRFAERYYSEIAPAVHFHAPDLFKRLCSEFLPPDMAYSFDRSLILGKFIPAEEFFQNPPVALLNGDRLPIRDTGTLRKIISNSIEALSCSNTVKTGDLIIPSPEVNAEIKIGDFISIERGENRLLGISIK